MADLTEEDWKRLAEEMRALREGVTNITLAWSGIENDLALLLSSVPGDGPRGEFSSAIYFAPSNSETRIKIVDAAFDTLSSTSDQHEAITDLWQRTLRRINRLKDTRNAVAHGTIATMNIRGKNHVRLAGALFDWRRSVPSLAKGQIPGLSANDIANSATKMGEVSKILTDFWKVPEAIRAGDESTLRGTLLQIEADLKKAFPPQDAQTQRAPDSPPRSSARHANSNGRRFGKSPNSTLTLRSTLTHGCPLAPACRPIQ